MKEFKNPCKGVITSQFGRRFHPITKKENFHNGVDIATVVGSPIVAPDDGTITEVWNHKTGGKSLAMVNKAGVRFGFAHLSEQLMPIGTTVLAGELIARSGNTGASTGPHVHFTVKINGAWQDPMLHFSFK